MNILFITSTRIGDAVLSTGLLSRLLEDNPGARVTVVCGPAAAGLFEAVPNLERLIVMEKMLFSLHWLRMWALSMGTFWHRVVDLRNAPLSYLLAARRQNHMGPRDDSVHRVERLARVLAIEGDPPAPKLWLSPEHRARAERLIPEGSPVLAIGPTANWEAKTWRPDRFARLCERIAAPDGLLPGCRVVLFGRDDERPGVVGLIETIPEDRRIDLIGRVGLLDISACLERSALYIGNDSGLMHIAAASGVSTLGLFGPSKEELYGPWGKRCASVRTPQSFDTIHPEGFDHRTSESLMDGLTVERVEEAARALLDKTDEAAA